MNSSWHLRNIDVFEMLPPSALQRLAAVMDSRSFERGARVFEGADAGNCLYVLRRGRVKLSRFSSDGREFVLGVVESGEIFGEDALCRNGARGMFAEVIDAADVSVLPVDDFNRLLVEYPEISLRLSRVMSKRLAEARQRMTDLVFKNIAGRVAGLLLHLVASYGEPEGEVIRLNHRITHQEIANRIGSTRETVTATLNGFKRRGLLRIQGRQLLVDDVAGLEAIYADSGE